MPDTEHTTSRLNEEEYIEYSRLRLIRTPDTIYITAYIADT